MTIRDPIPEHVRKLMDSTDRQQVNAPTVQEADQRFIARKEKELQNQIANLLRQRNITFFQQRMDRRTTGRVGQPDFLFAINGRACAVECKMPGASLTQEQKNTLIELQDNGWRTWIARSVDDFLAWVKDIETVEEMSHE